MCEEAGNSPRIACELNTLIPEQVFRENIRNSKKNEYEKSLSGTIKFFPHRYLRQKREPETPRSQEAIKNVTTNAIGVAQATNPLITVATYVAVFLTVVPIGLFGFVQVLRAQPSTARTTVLTAEADETAAELTAAERRAQRKAAREAKNKTAVTEPEVTVEIATPNTGFNGNGMQNADFGTMPTPFAGGFGMMPMPPFGGFPGFGTMPQTDTEGFNGFGTIPQTDTEAINGFGAMQNPDENTFNGFGAGMGYI